MMPKAQIIQLKFQLYESREKFNHLVRSINKNEKTTINGVPIFELISQIYTEKIELLDIILNHENRKKLERN